jgi:DNA-binding NarL/FixJ family response regulator
MAQPHAATQRDASDHDDVARTFQPPPGARVPLTIVSNSHLLHEGLASLLANYLPCEVVQRCAGEDQPEAQPDGPPGHTVLVDSGIGRLAANRWTRYWSARPTTYAIVIELAEDADQILGCIEAGACAYTLRGASVADVAAAIALAHRGEAQCSPALTARLFARLAARGQPPSDLPLSGRELEVVRLIAAGYSNQAIAAALVIEVRTVKHHVHNILDKLKLRHRGEAADYATAQGWL